jgi:Domain of unknown function (DUF4129)
MRRRPCRAAAILPAVLLITLAPQAHAAGCPSLDYRAALAAASAALEQTPAEIAQAQRDIAGLGGTDPGALGVLGPVLSDLSTSPPDLADAQLRLASMSATLAYPAGSVCNESAQAARHALGGVYASPDLRHLDDSTRPGLLASILSFLANLVGRAAGALGPAGAVLLAVALVGIALFVAWRRWHGAAALRGAVVDEPATVGDDPEAEWRAAERAASAGDHREAVRRAFRSALLDVAIRGRVQLDAAWTTRELLERCHADGDVLVALAAAATLFERAWYSGNAVTADDWALGRHRCATVRRLATRAGAPAP